MPAYCIAFINVTNPDAYKNYAAAAGPATAKYGGTFRVRGGKYEVMEGKCDYQRIVVNEFADMDAARKFYNSVEYQAARQHRLGAADFNMIIVEGATA
jgi:uncharacterized protein (DUF1330 family)